MAISIDKIIAGSPEDVSRKQLLDGMTGKWGAKKGGWFFGTGAKEGATPAELYKKLGEVVRLDSEEEEVRLKGALAEYKGEIDGYVRRIERGDKLSAEETKQFSQLKTKAQEEIKKSTKKIDDAISSISAKIHQPETEVLEGIDKVREDLASIGDMRGEKFDASKLTSGAIKNDGGNLSIEVVDRKGKPVKYNIGTIEEVEIEKAILDSDGKIKTPAVKEARIKMDEKQLEAFGDAKSAVKSWESGFKEQISAMIKEVEQGGSHARAKLNSLSEAIEKVSSSGLKEAESALAKAEAGAKNGVVEAGEKAAAKGMNGWAKAGIGGLIGGAIGYFTGNEESKTTNAIIGAGIGAGASVALGAVFKNKALASELSHNAAASLSR